MNFVASRVACNSASLFLAASVLGLSGGGFVRLIVAIVRGLVSVLWDGATSVLVVTLGLEEEGEVTGDLVFFFGVDLVDLGVEGEREFRDFPPSLKGDDLTLFGGETPVGLVEDEDGL